jgi:hypothetical protein
MSSTMHHIATAALPVAIVLAACAGAARAVLWTAAGDAQLQRNARQHLEPLCLWCLAATGVFLFARAAAGGAGLGAFLLAIVVAGVALAVWMAGDGEGPRVAADGHGGAAEARETARPDFATAEPAQAEAASAPPADGHLWARPWRVGGRS